MKNSPPMRKWTILELIILFTGFVIYFGRISGKNAWESIENVLLQLVQIFPNVHNAIVKETGARYVYLCYAILIAAAFFCLISPSFRKRAACFLREGILGKEINESWEKNKKFAKGKIVFSEGLDDYQKVIFDMCQKAKLSHDTEEQGVFFVLRDLKKDNIFTIQKSGEPSVVVITPGFLQKLDGMPTTIRCRVLRFVLAHEIVHVKYRDVMNRKWLVLFHISLWGTGISIIGRCLMLTIGKEDLKVFFAALPILLIWVIVGSVFSSPTYWSQVVKFRADRMALDISGEPPQIFEVYTKYFPDAPPEKKNVIERVAESMKLFVKVFIMGSSESDNIAHPSNRMRRLELNSGRKWNFSEYFRYGLRMRLNMIGGKGGRL